MDQRLVVSPVAIQEHRLRAGLSVAELAAKAGLSSGGLHNLERRGVGGKPRRNPQMATVRAIAAALGVEIAELLRPAGPAEPGDTVEADTAATA